MLKFFLCLRYLRKKRIVFLSIAAVALSVSLLIVVSSLFTGFIDAFEKAAVEAIGDVVIFPPIKFAKYPILIEQLEQTETVEAATAMLSNQGLLHLGKGNVRAVDIWGIEPVRRAKVTGFDRFLLNQKNLHGKISLKTNGSKEKSGGFVGIGLLAEPDEKTDKYDLDAVKKMFGQQVILTTGTVTETAGDDSAGPEVKRRVIPFTIVDAVETGVYQFDQACVYLAIEELQKAIYPDENLPVAAQIQIKLADNVDTENALAVIRGVWQNFIKEHMAANPYLLKYTNIETAEQLQSRYVAAYQKQMGVLLLIFGIVSLGVILLVFCIFYMIVRLKQKDIAIVKSCGTTGSAVACIFMAFGTCVGTAGSLLGVILGYAVTKNINVIEDWISIIFRMKLWNSSVYFFTKIPNDVDWISTLPIVLIAIIAAAIGALIPAIIAARTKPVEILRYE
jgi:lipoprotein-releasing system permease protein